MSSSFTEKLEWELKKIKDWCLDFFLKKTTMEMMKHLKEKKVPRQQVRSLNHSFLFPFLVTFYKWNHREITTSQSQGDIANAARKTSSLH